MTQDDWLGPTRLSIGKLPECDCAVLHISNSNYALSTEMARRLRDLLKDIPGGWWTMFPSPGLDRILPAVCPQGKDHHLYG